MGEWRQTRTVILFWAGIAGVVHETVVSDLERPTLLLLFAAMMGLGVGLWGNGRRNGDRPLS